MAIDSLPLFSPMNREEVKPPFHHPNRPLTSQEAHFAIMEKVNACIAEVNHFEQRVQYEMEKYIAKTDTENTGFKEAIQASYNVFMETVQREVNNFEVSIQNNFDIYRNDIDKRVADFQTAINNEFSTLEENILTRANEKIVEMENTRVICYEEFKTYRSILTEAVDNFKTQVLSHMESQDIKIEEYKNYMVTNILNNVRRVFEDKLKTGEITNIITPFFGDNCKFIGTWESYNGLPMKEDLAMLTNGCYAYVENENVFYMYSEEMWFSIGHGIALNDDYKSFKLNILRELEELSEKEMFTPSFLYGKAVEEGINLKTTETWATTYPIPVNLGDTIVVEGYAPHCRYLDINGNYIVGSYQEFFPLNDSNPIFRNEFNALHNGFIQFSCITRTDHALYQKPDELVIAFKRAVTNLSKNCVKGENIVNGAIMPNHLGMRLHAKMTECKRTRGVVNFVPWHNDGVYQEDKTKTAYVVSDYIPISPLTDYWLNVYYASAGVIYDENKNPICGLDRNVNNGDAQPSTILYKLPFTTPKNARYIRINCRLTELDIQCIGYGNNVLSDEEIKNYNRFDDFPFLMKDNSQWRNKKFVVLGDSISWQDGNYYPNTENIAIGYQTLLQEALGFSEHLNKAISGRPVANGTANGDGTVTTALEVDYANYDLCIIAGGSNDNKLNVPIHNDKPNGYNLNTFEGAYCSMIEHILTSNPEIKICLATPLHRYQEGYDDTTTNTAGHKEIEYVEMIEKIGTKYSLPVCDWYRNSGINRFTIDTFTRDGVHPTDKGYEKMSNYIIKFIDSI